jgi:hypothetical protein
VAFAAVALVTAVVVFAPVAVMFRLVILVALLVMFSGRGSTANWPCTGPDAAVVPTTAIMDRMIIAVDIFVDKFVMFVIILLAPLTYYGYINIHCASNFLALFAAAIIAISPR